LIGFGAHGHVLEKAFAHCHVTHLIAFHAIRFERRIGLPQASALIAN
jgi:hypothetical protein